MIEDYFDTIIKDFYTFTKILKDELPLTVRHDHEWIMYFDYKCKSLLEKFEEYRGRPYYDMDRFYSFMQNDLTELFAFLIEKERAKINNATTICDKLNHIPHRTFYRFSPWAYCLLRFNSKKDYLRRKLPSIKRQEFDDKCKSLTEELKEMLKELHDEENCNVMYYIAVFRPAQEKLNQIHIGVDAM